MWNIGKLIYRYVDVESVGRFFKFAKNRTSRKEDYTSIEFETDIEFFGFSNFSKVIYNYMYMYVILCNILLDIHYT